MISFAEEIFLLALDDKQGIIKPLPVSALDYALAGALLMDLALQDGRDTDLTSLGGTNTKPTCDPSLYDTWREVQQKPGGGVETRPRIAVAGLNPHAGEGGLFGDEEIRVILPAVAALCQAQNAGRA